MNMMINMISMIVNNKVCKNNNSLKWIIIITITIFNIKWKILYISVIDLIIWVLIALLFKII